MWLSPHGFMYCIKPVPMVVSDTRVSLMQLGAWRISGDLNHITNQWTFRKKTPVFIGWTGLLSPDIEFQLDGHTVAGCSVANL